QENPSGNVFFLRDSSLPATTCSVSYSISNVTSTTFKGNMTIRNTGNQSIVGWAVNFGLYQGQTLQQPVAGAVFSENGAVKTASNLFGNAIISPGGSVNVSF